MRPILQYPDITYSLRTLCLSPVTERNLYLASVSGFINHNFNGLHMCAIKLKRGVKGKRGLIWWHCPKAGPSPGVQLPPGGNLGLVAQARTGGRTQRGGGSTSTAWTLNPRRTQRAHRLCVFSFCITKEPLPRYRRSGAEAAWCSKVLTRGCSVATTCQTKAPTRV